MTIDPNKVSTSFEAYNASHYSIFYLSLATILHPKGKYEEDIGTSK
jgi:hypothetical protein